MALRSGFWDSIGGDRVYSAYDMGIPFDGLISDGVFQNWGSAFRCEPGSDGKTLLISSGKGWKNHRWAVNDAAYEYQFNFSGVNSGNVTWCVLCLDFKVESFYRYAQFTQFWAGPGKTHTSETALLNWLVTDQTLNTLPLYLIRFEPAASTIQAANITTLVGSQWCPYITGLVQQVTIDDIRQRWENAHRELVEGIADEAQGRANLFEATFENQLTSWFANLQATLEGNVAVNLANQLAQTQATINELVTKNQITATLEFVHEGQTNPATTDGGLLFNAIQKFAPIG